MSDDEFEAVLNRLSDVEMAAVLGALRDLRRELAALDARVSVLEAEGARRG